MGLDDFFQSKNWEIVDLQTIPPREAQYSKYNDISLSNKSKSLFKYYAPKGIYQHRKEAIRVFLEGKHICLTTGTIEHFIINFSKDIAVFGTQNPSGFGPIGFS